MLSSEAIPLEATPANQQPGAADKVRDDALWYLSGKVHSNEPVRHVPLNSFPFRIGRRTDLTFCLPFPTVSGLHAEIVPNGPHIVLHDLDSTNGTFVNGTQISEPRLLRQNDLVQFANVAFRAGKRSSDCTKTIEHDVIEEVAALVQFEKLLEGGGLTPFYQPIVDIHKGHTLGYEVLARSSLDGLRTPAAMFEAAAQLSMEIELSQSLRLQGLPAGEIFGKFCPLYVNTHPAEMEKAGLIESLREARHQFPEQAITVEIHESAVSDASTMKGLRDELNRLNIGLAYDDFGAGQARLIELIEVRPDVLKFDRCLIRNIHKASPKQQEAVATLVAMTRQLGVVALAEGVETEGEHHACCQVGFEMGQGFFYGRPAPPTKYRAGR
jgi:EAL domain-containing protein (putative c-di-GMP-specific phosphodiesterase class I)